MTLKAFDLGIRDRENGISRRVAETRRDSCWKRNKNSATPGPAGMWIRCTRRKFKNPWTVRNWFCLSRRGVVVPRGSTLSQIDSPKVPQLSTLPLMIRTGRHPVNPWISNGILVDFYLGTLRKRQRLIRRLLETLLNTEIDCPLPAKLFLPHPYGIIVGTTSHLAENVTLMHQVTLGGRDPWCQNTDLKNEYPRLEEGVYVGAGAKVIGPVKIGAWAMVGANAVVTKDVPPMHTVVGSNQILPPTEERKELLRSLNLKSITGSATVPG